MRTGSSVRSPGSDFLTSVTAFCVTSTSSLSVSSSASSLVSSSLSASSASETLMPMSESIDMMSSICSGEVVSDGKNFVELIEGHEAALLGLLDHLLDGGIGQIEQRRRRVRGILLRRVGCLVVFFLVLDLQRLCLAGHSLLPKRAHAGCVAAPAFESLTSFMTRKGRRKRSPPSNRSRRFRTLSPQAIKLRLTLFLQPNHGFGESFRGSGRRRPQHFLIRRSAGTGLKTRRNPRSGPRYRPLPPAGP